METRASVYSQEKVAGYVVAAFAPIVVAALLVPLRGELVTTNLALILVLTVVAAAVIGGRGPGAVAAVVATISYDFFLTRPYLSFRIDSADDLETTVILLFIGLIVGQLALVARRHQTAAIRGSRELASVHRVATRVAEGAPVEEVVEQVAAELTRMLDLRACRFEEPPFPEQPVGLALPRVERTGAMSGVARHKFIGRGFAIPDVGAELPVHSRGSQVGRFVLEADGTHGVSIEELVTAVALADQLGMAIATKPRDTAEATVS